MGDSGTPLLYSQSPSSAFSLFPTNGLYLSADSASTSPHARERQHQPPRAMLCTALGPYNTAPFSVADSPDSSSGSGSLSNTDGSPPESPVDDIHGADHTHGFGYSHDLFDQQFRAMFTSQVGDPLSYPGSNALEMSHHYIIKHEHQQAAIYDSYQPFLDSCSEPISPYSNSQQFRATDDSSEHFGTSSAAALLPPVYEFPGQYHSQTGRSIAATPLASSDPDTSAGIDAGYMLTAASHVRYTGGTSHNDMTQQPRAQLSPRCVRITEYSPSPPLYDTSELDDAQVCDPRFVSGSEDGGRLADVNRRYKPRDGVLSASSTIAPTSPFNHDVSHDSEEEVQEQDDREDDEYKDSGESEIEQDLRDDDDGEFMLRPNRRTRFNQNTRANRAATSELSLSSHSSSSLSAGALDVQMPTGDVLVKRTRGLTAPVPVPNLTKKSRGRRVPTVSTIVAHGGVQKNTRMYTCKVKDCGKCFARGEHLKRHVRSIHTNEKPHKCPFPGCGKDFSRHDNLGQHMRVHKTHQATRDFV